MLTGRLTSHGQRLLFLAGCHDWVPMLNDRSGLTPEWPLGGIRWISSRVGFLPNGYRGSFIGGRTFAVFGGAASADRMSRAIGDGWRRTGVSSDGDLKALGRKPVDILLGHNAPLDLPEIDAVVEEKAKRLPPEDLQFGIDARAQFHRGFLQIAPSLYVGAHYRQFTSDAVGYRDGGTGFWSNVAILDQLEGPDVSMAILDTRTCSLEFLDWAGHEVRTPKAVSKLTMDGTGRWMVQTESSVHFVDLDSRYWERIPGPDANPTLGRNAGPLRSLENFILGSNGYLTTSGDEHAEYYWVRTSMIRHITGAPLGD
ncbi:hypothetical protein GCM10009717_21530 [Agromyces allii]|uniref:Uncharacterized protein n=2 Tax=Agromyces allii TaxID=393607 RepID=A0ABP5C350_9MICO